MKNTVRLTAAQALLQFLDNQYLEHEGRQYKFFEGIFGIFGHGNVLGIGEALEYHRPLQLKYYRGHNEQGMVHAAAAFAKQNRRRRAFICTSSIGPGALNMVTGAGTATVNRLPVLLIPGDTFADRQPDPVLQQLEQPQDYSLTVNDAFRPVSRYFDRINRPEQVMAAASEAVRVLTDPADTGAVTLAFPQDVQGEFWDYPEDFFAKRIHYLDRRPPNLEAVDRLVSAIAQKQRPLLIAGGGVRYSEAEAWVRSFAEKRHIPVVTTQAGKGALPWDHPLNMGGIGTTGTEAANVLAREADLVFAVGTRLQDFTTASKTAFDREHSDIVSINVNRMDGRKMEAMWLDADAKEGLSALDAGLDAVQWQPAQRSDHLQQLKKCWNEEVNRLYAMPDDEGLPQTTALGIVNECVEDNAIMVGSSGSLPGDMQRLWRCRRADTYHMEYGFSCMGYEIAGAYGVKLAEPDRPVYSMLSDGSYLMMHSELTAAMQEGVKIVVVLMDNGGYQCIHDLQCSHGSRGFGNELRYRSGDTLSGDYLAIDFAAMAKGLGLEAFRAENAVQLRDALRRAQESPKSVLLDIKVKPGTHSGGYASWWRVGVSQVSQEPAVEKAAQEAQQYLKKHQW